MIVIVKLDGLMNKIGEMRKKWIGKEKELEDTNAEEREKERVMNVEADHELEQRNREMAILYNHVEVVKAHETQPATTKLNRTPTSQRYQTRPNGTKTLNERFHSDTERISTGEGTIVSIVSSKEYLRAGAGSHRPTHVCGQERQANLIRSIHPPKPFSRYHLEIDTLISVFGVHHVR